MAQERLNRPAQHGLASKGAILLGRGCDKIVGLGALTPSCGHDKRHGFSHGSVYLATDFVERGPCAFA
jgi:hypothetical protein